LGGVFEIPAGTGTIDPLVNFDGNDAGDSTTGVVMDSDGSLWGVGSSGGDSNGDGTVYEIQRQGRLVITTAAATVTAGAAQAFTVDLENAAGAVDTGNQSTVTLSIASGPQGAAMGGTLTVTAVNGIARFAGITFTESGTYTLTADSDGLTPFTSAGITVNAASASHLVFAQQPGSALAGGSIGTVVVDIEDQYGNLAVGDSSVVTLAGVSLTGTLTKNAHNGVATFTGLAIDRAGVSSLTATDGGLAPVTSVPITTSPAAAAKLVFAQQPITGTELQTLGTIAVDIEDAFGNLITTNSSTVTLTGSDSLGGTTSEAAAGGVATFSNVSIAQFGTQVLSAIDGSLSAAASSAIAVAPALASLTITAPATTLDQGGTLQLQANGVNPLGSPVALSDVAWSLDAGSTGSIDQNGLFTAGDTAGLAMVEASCEGQTATFSITVNGSPVIAVQPYVQQVTPASNTATLHVQGQQAGGNTNLIYTWSIVSQPAVVSGRLYVGSSPLAVFSVNGTNSAANTSVTFLASGTYTLEVTASDGIQSVSSDVQLTATVKSSIAKTLALTTQVSGVSTIGNAQEITGFVVSFNGPLDSATAQDIRGYRIRRLVGGTIEPASAVYDPATCSVTLTLAKPMLVQRGTGIVQVLGAGKYGVRDAQGHLIDGDSNGIAGGTFTWSFSMQVAKTISYRTATGDLVALTLTGPGKIVSLLPAGSSAPIITLTGTNPTGSILTGKLRKGRKSLGYVVLDQLNGTSLAEIQLGTEFHVNEYDASNSQG
jgi:hypothetical protein